MTSPRITDWQFWNSLACARLPLGLLVAPRRIEHRTQMKDFRPSAYVFRMFDLFFYPLRDEIVTGRLEIPERTAIRDFIAAFDSLPWAPLASHPHISELVDDGYCTLAPLAKSLDRFLWLRIGRGPIPLAYRLARGWPLFEASLRAKEKANQSPEPTAMSVTPPAAQEPRQP